MADVEPAGVPPSAGEADLVRKVMDGAPVAMFVVDTGGIIRWISGVVDRIFGYRPDELIGSNMLDHVDLEWSQEALESIGTAFSSSGLQRPMLFRVRRKDGSFIVAEVTANSQLDDPAVNGLMVYIRRWDERHLLDRVLESLAGDGSLDETFRLLVQVMGAETLEADGVILHAPDGGGAFTEAVASDLLPASLSTDHDLRGSPWHIAASTGRPVSVRVADLPSPLRSAATEHGYAWCWAWPVAGSDPGRAGACLVLWRRADEDTDDTCRFLLDNLVRLTGLVVERERAAIALRHAATHDALTGLPNRTHFFDRLQDLLDAPAGATRVGVLYIDLDGFKPVNDHLGHGAGDQVLREVGRRMEEVVGERGLVARLGGDEFTVLCPAVVGDEVLAALARELNDVVRRPIMIGTNEVAVSASVGIAASAPGACSIDVLIDAADAALYEVKSGDKGGFRFAPEVLDLR